MPDRTKLKIGDRIRLLHVPPFDLEQRERELRAGDVEDPGWTADTIEKIIQQNPIVTIMDVDEFGYPWFSRKLDEEDEGFEHWLAIMDDDSWTYS